MDKNISWKDPYAYPSNYRQGGEGGFFDFNYQQYRCGYSQS